MVVFPPCKINLGLHILSKRSDGFHEIETCFYPVPWTDVLEIIPSDHFDITFSGLPIPGGQDDNLCVKALALLKNEYQLPEIRMHLHKVVPVGAGLGGGSSDAAAVLKLLNDLFALGMNEEKLMSLAAQLGSDCPFFISQQPMLGTGKGEQLKPTAVSLSGEFVTLVNPGIAISTRDAYRDAVPKEPLVPLVEILGKPMSDWKKLLSNDFESSTFKKYPQLQAIKDKLYGLGAWYASMSGSGSTMFGLFNKPIDVRSDFPGMEVWSGKLP